jgi:hypothetical protein
MDVDQKWDAPTVPDGVLASARRPNAVEPHPQEPICGEEPNPTWALPPQDTHLMSKGNELEFPSCPRAVATRREAAVWTVQDLVAPGWTAALTDRRLTQGQVAELELRLSMANS